MTKTTLLPLLVLAALVLNLSSPSTRPKPLVFTHVTIIDVTGAPVKSDMTVAIDGNRISELGPSTKLRVPQDAQVVDATGKFLIPGLWDMHVHWFRYDKAFLQLFPINGVTGVRIMWGAPIHFAWRKEIEEGALLGPRMTIAGTILDGPKPIWPGSMAISNEREAREAVISTKQQGYDLVKVYSLLPRKAYFAIADEAKKQGIAFAGHVPFFISATEASDAGQKSIEHLTGILAACSSRDEELRQRIVNAYSNLRPGQILPNPSILRPLTRLMLETFSMEKANAVFARLKQNQTWQCPTFTVLRSGAFMDDPDFRRDPRLKYMPAQLRTSWNPSNDFRFRSRTAEDFQLARLVYKKQIELVGLMRRAGVEFIAGTDVLNPFCFPGFSLHDELVILVEAGLSPMEALQTATLNPARYLGKEKDLGTIAQGKVADLVLLEANPLEDIRNTTKINSVVANGRLLGRKALDQLLTQVQASAQK
jgi:cytosine/adenosine deaminase-related metal-dependent hydrolase